MAQALAGLGVDHAFVVHSADGLDEISIATSTTVTEMHKGEFRTLTITPEDFGIAPAALELLRGGDAKHNAAIIESILNGEQGPRREVVLMNAAPGIVAAGAATDFKAAIRIAASSIDTRAALKRLNALREWK